MALQVKCPGCGCISDITDNPFRPFCSERCKTTDLGAWADEKYSIPGKTACLEVSEVTRNGSGQDRTYH